LPEGIGIDVVPINLVLLVQNPSRAVNIQQAVTPVPANGQRIAGRAVQIQVPESLASAKVPAFRLAAFR
jgi:hypothetical protein